MEINLGDVLAQSVAAAKVAWWSNFRGAYHSGDHNRAAISRIATAVFKQATTDVNPAEVRKFLSTVSVTKD